MKYTPFLDFKSRLTHEMQTIEGPAKDTPEEAYRVIKFLIRQVEPMDGEYSACVVESIR